MIGKCKIFLFYKKANKIGDISEYMCNYTKLIFCIIEGIEKAAKSRFLQKSNQACITTPDCFLYLWICLPFKILSNAHHENLRFLVATK